METALRIQTTILPGHRIEIAAPELPEGQMVEVIVVFPELSRSKTRTILNFLDALSPGPRTCSSWEKVEQHLQQERDSWER